MSNIIRPILGTDPQDVVKIPDVPAITIVPSKQASPAADNENDKKASADIVEPQTQTIDYDAFMQQAQQEADRLAQKMIIHAKKERGEILAAAEREAEKIKEQAQKEGYMAGSTNKAAQIDDAINSISVALGQLKYQQEQYFKEYGQRLKFLAVEIADKIICDTVEQDESAIVPLIQKAVDTVKDADWVTVEISNRLTAAAPFLEKEYQKTRPGKARIEIKTIDADLTTCILHTPDGTIDASVSVQLNNLKEYFTRMDLQPE